MSGDAVTVGSGLTPGTEGQGAFVAASRVILANYFSSLSRTTQSIAILWVLVFLVSAVFVRFTRLSNVPGPFWAAYTRLWLSKQYYSGCLYQKYHETSRRWGPLVRIAPNRLLLADPEATMEMLSSRSRYERGPWYDSFKIDPERPNIVSQRDRPTHLRMRYQMAPGYSGKDIAGFEGIMDTRIVDLVDRISTNWISRPERTLPLDIGRWIRHMTMDTITHISFGKPFGYAENDRDIMEFTSVMEALLPIVLHFSVFTELNNILRLLAKVGCLRRVLFPHHTHKKGLGRLRAVTKNIMASRSPPLPDTKSDMLDSFLKNGLSPQEAESEMAIGLVAGSDTTSTGLRATVLAIISNPLVYRKLQVEIDTCIADGQVSSPIKDSEARKMPYLQACIYEGLRCHPPLVLPRERVVPPEGDIICGYKIPAGTFVGVNVWTSQRHDIFGEDPEVFRPERWLEASDEQLRAMKKTWELIFGHGTTKCLGQQVALMTMNKFFPEVSWNHLPNILSNILWISVILAKLNR
ncbi:putative benzoate 4-monooxygenase cytochrome P450 [Lophiotrema nucula]|uniref:Putative benzoate 4-monooxygenase cytochrome P450 n=1 Tax=Lophiotrema nucula TaxID=690887 RepID=A0A6A5YHQ4_9PLEO|nr:putative benzoate 4-monooxygenase cytochrome P450 [Lophiotrema nucula]